MKLRFKILINLLILTKLTDAQNWASVNCFGSTSYVERMFLDSLHNKIILSARGVKKVCNKAVRNIYSYDGENFDDMNGGLQTHDTIYAWKLIATAAIAYQNKTMIGGDFQSVGNPYKFSPMIANWDGIKWDTLTKGIYKNVQNDTLGYINGFYKWQNKLFIYGSFNNISEIPGKSIYSFDGVNYNLINIPVNNNSRVNKVMMYKDTLYISGLFFNNPTYDIDKIIKYDGTNFYPVANGIKGGFAGVGDMVVYKDTLYLAGVMNKADGNAGNHIMKWDGKQFLDAGFGTFHDYGGINQLLIFKNRLYAFGRFSYAADKRAFFAAYYENGKWTPNTDSLNNTINSAVVFNNEIYIAGGFTSINGNDNLKYFVKLRCPDFDNCGSGIGYSNNPSIYPNPFNNELTINTTTSDPNTLKKITLTNLLGQIIYTTEFYQNNITLNLPQIPSGAYIAQLYLNNKFSYRTKLIKQ